jgi:phosphatidyl-myo-inositol dimannoside synthase
MGARRILVVTPDLGLGEDGGHRPGGVALFARLVIQALATMNGLAELTTYSLLDTAPATWAHRTRLPGTVAGFAGSKLGLALAYLRACRRHDMAMFLHLGVGQLAALTPFARTSLWLVGIEAWRRLLPHERLVVRRAAPLLSISRFTSDEVRRFNSSLPAAVPVHLAADPATDLPPGQDRDRRYDAARREPAVLIVSRLAAGERYKGHDQLLGAWPEVVRARPDARLWIVGDGDDLPRLRGVAASLPAPARAQVEILGALDEEALRDRYRRARVFAMPSVKEGFGLVFVEAMRSGVPCIASFDAAAEIVLDGVTGLVVPQTASAIAGACSRLLNDDALANRFSEAGHRRYQEQFTFQAFRTRLLGALAAGQPDTGDGAGR